jgi:hypothetical protein
MEFLQVRELLSTEALAVKKCKLYANDAGDEQLRNIFREAAQVHERNLDALLNQVRNHQGKPAREQQAREQPAAPAERVSEQH